MRRWIAALMLMCLLLTGCSSEKNALQPALDFRSQLLEHHGCAYQAEVSADYGDHVYEFSLDCAFDGENGRITVTAPESIRGISAAVSGADCKMTFDGVVLDFGVCGNAAPLSVPCLLGTAWQSDYIASCGADGEYQRVTMIKGYGEEELTIDTWLSDGVPAFADVSADGVSVLRVRISDFTLRD